MASVVLPHFNAESVNSCHSYWRAIHVIFKPLNFFDSSFLHFFLPNALLVCDIFWDNCFQSPSSTGNFNKIKERIKPVLGGLRLDRLLFLLHYGNKHLYCVYIELPRTLYSGVQIFFPFKGNKRIKLQNLNNLFICSRYIFSKKTFSDLIYICWDGTV